MKVYLDNAASTPISPEVSRLISEIMGTVFANPSSVHESGRKSKILVESSRKTIAKILNTPPGTIFFTSGGTEADNMAIKCAIYDYNIKHAITSKLSHHAVLYPLEDLAAENKIQLSYVNFDKYGEIDLEHLEELLVKNERTFVSIMHANNEIGTIQDIKAIGDICKRYNALFHSDTVQTIAHYPFDMNKLNIDFLAASAHKFHGPKGVGFIYISKNVQIHPLIRGGAQERNMRAGTENIHSIAGMAKAFEISCQNMKKDKEYIRNLKHYMIDQLKENIPGIEFYGCSENLEKSLYKVLAVSFPETDIAEMLLFNLDIMGIACSGGSACTSGSTKGSHVLSAISPNSKRTGIRFSFSKYNTKEEIDYTILKLKELFSK